MMVPFRSLWFATLSLASALGVKGALRQPRAALELAYDTVCYNYDVYFDNTTNGAIDNDDVVCIETSMASNMDRLTRLFAEEQKHFQSDSDWWHVKKITYLGGNGNRVTLFVKNAHKGLVKVFEGGVLAYTKTVKLANNFRRWLKFAPGVADKELERVVVAHRNTQTKRPRKKRNKKKKNKKKENKKNKNKKNRRIFHASFNVKADCTLCDPDDIDMGRRRAFSQWLAPLKMMGFVNWMNERLDDVVSQSCPLVWTKVSRTTFVLEGHDIASETTSFAVNSNNTFVEGVKKAATNTFTSGESTTVSTSTESGAAVSVSAEKDLDGGKPVFVGFARYFP